jgi:hypothetical protein
MLGIQARENHILALLTVGHLGHFLLGRLEALVVFLRIFVKFQDLGFSLRT